MNRLGGEQSAVRQRIADLHCLPFNGWWPYVWAAAELGPPSRVHVVDFAVTRQAAWSTTSAGAQPRCDPSSMGSRLLYQASSL